MPKTLFQNIVFTAIMALFMVYGMIVYNIALATGGVTNQTFVMALGELKIMAPIAFLLEFFIVDKLAHKLAFTFVKPTDRPTVIACAISFCICCVMCPVMSLIATLLFKEPRFGTWVQTFGMNLPCALLWQLCYCGPLVRLIFRALFREKKAHQPVALLQPPLLVRNAPGFPLRLCGWGSRGRFLLGAPGQPESCPRGCNTFPQKATDRAYRVHPRSAGDGLETTRKTGGDGRCGQWRNSIGHTGRTSTAICAA